MMTLHNLPRFFLALWIFFSVGQSMSPAHAATVTYYHNDALGSPIAATDAAGALLWRETYRPYGERLDDPAADKV